MTHIPRFVYIVCGVLALAMVLIGVGVLRARVTSGPSGTVTAPPRPSAFPASPVPPVVVVPTVVTLTSAPRPSPTATRPSPRPTATRTVTATPTPTPTCRTPELPVLGCLVRPSP